MSNIIYWYNDGENIRSTWVEPNISHVVQKISPIGIPGAKAVQYNYKNKNYDFVLHDIDMDNTEIVAKIMNGDI